MDVSGQEAVAQPRGRGSGTGVREVAEVQLDGRGQHDKRRHDNEPKKNRGGKDLTRPKHFTQIINSFYSFNI